MSTGDPYFDLLLTRPATPRGRTSKSKRRPRRGADGKPLEHVIQKACLAALSKHRNVAKVWRQQAGVVTTQESQRVMRLGPAGIADIGGIMSDGRALQIEVKRPGADVSPGDAQWRWLTSCHAAGAVAGVAHSPEEALSIVDEQ